jgi:hypothetical protein
LLGALLATACSPSPDAPQSCPPDAPGYKASIAPLIGASCVGCHMPGGSATPDLHTYAEVFALRGPVLNEVTQGRMPPTDAPPLNSVARADLLSWLACGAPDD